jgi:hypothetical protein
MQMFLNGLLEMQRVCLIQSKFSDFHKKLYQFKNFLYCRCLHNKHLSDKYFVSLCRLVDSNSLLRPIICDIK